MAQLEKIAIDYERDGFATIKNVIDANLMSEVRTHIEWLVKKYPGLRPEHLHHPLIRNDAFWVRLITDTRLADIAEFFLGPNIACFTAHYVCKPPQDGQAVLWHQDAAYWSLEPMTALTIWLAVDSSHTKNGCLRMVPGTHRMPVYAHLPRMERMNVLFSACDDELVCKLVNNAGIVDLELEPGDVSIHHPKIIHCSEPNTSPLRRCGLDIGYIPTSTRISSDGLYLDPILVRGKPAAGINSYRRYPRYSPTETIPWTGHEKWNERADAINAYGQYVNDFGAARIPPGNRATNDTAPARGNRKTLNSASTFKV
jgi:ectoine hydroxylase-related dioxygenase (phytanoyl-CoA dioxygenase family)